MAYTDDSLMSNFGILIFGVYTILLAVAIIAGLVVIWPDEKQMLMQGILGPDTRFMLVVALSGALGSYVHMATSFAEFVGNRMLMRSWLWWYILRPFIGLSWSVLVYFVLRGVMFSGTSSMASVNPFGIAAVAGLIGMFSKQATDKVREIFDAFFRTERAVGRADASPRTVYGTGPTSGTGSGPTFTN